jgi:hypothetical protein
VNTKKPAIIGTDGGSMRRGRGGHTVQTLMSFWL